MSKNWLSQMNSKSKKRKLKDQKKSSVDSPAQTTASSDRNETSPSPNQNPVPGESEQSSNNTQEQAPTNVLKEPIRSNETPNSQVNSTTDSSIAAVAPSAPQNNIRGVVAGNKDIVNESLENVKEQPTEPVAMQTIDADTSQKRVSWEEEDEFLTQSNTMSEQRNESTLPDEDKTKKTSSPYIANRPQLKPYANVAAEPSVEPSSNTGPTGPPQNTVDPAKIRPTTIQFQRNEDTTTTNRGRQTSIPTVGDVIARSRRKSSDVARGELQEYLRKDRGDGSQSSRRLSSASAGSPVEKYRAFRTAYNEKNTRLITLGTLYKEALYTSVHYLGTPTNRFPATSEDLCFYSHIAFKADPHDQMATMEHVVGEPFPLTVVNVNIRRCIGVPDREGFELPSTYCVVSVETDETSVEFQVDTKEWQRITTDSPIQPKTSQSVRSIKLAPEKRVDQVYEHVPGFVKTSVQPKTKNPSWDQRFQCLAIRPSVDLLTIELWDKESSDNGSTVPAKASKNKMKSRKYDVFLGKISLPIKGIPCEGESKWHVWKGSTQRKRTSAGKLLIEVWLTQAYRHGKHFEDYAEPRTMLEMFWDHILNYESSRYTGEWSGDIPPAATCLMFQYALQTGISEACQAIIRWNAYAKYNLGLYALGRRLTELESSLTTANDWKDVRECELETKMVILAVEKILPTIRNHLNEKQEAVQDALKAITHCREILTKFDINDQGLFQVQFWIQAEIRMGILEWYQARFRDLMGSCFQVTGLHYAQYEMVECVAKLINEVNAVMRTCRTKWKPLFWLQGFIDYMPLAFDEFQKMIIHDVETVCWNVLQDFDTNEKLRSALINLDENTKRLCRALFDLYVETQVFVAEQGNIFDQDTEKRYYHLNQYHRWFRPVLVLWLGYALIRASDMISISIRIDTSVVEDANKLTSSSAIDASVVYNQLATFWQQLNWPDIAEGYCILHYLFEVMCFITVLYARQKRLKLEHEGYFDTEDRFDISERLCTALNNIEYVKESLIKIPDAINMDAILVELDRVVGVSYAQHHRLRINQLLTSTLAHTEIQFKKILAGVAERVRPELRECLKQSFKILQTPQNTEDDALVPLLSYLEDNIIVLHRSLLELNFVRVLQMFWDVTCQELLYGLQIFIQEEDVRNQEPFFRRIQTCIASLVNYYQGGSEGLNDEEINTKYYQSLQTFLTCIPLPTELLIATYYRIAGEEQIGPMDKSILGTLTARVTYFQEELRVEVLSAKNLSARDIPLAFFKYCCGREASSDPVVEVSLQPPSNFSYTKTQRTKIHWRTQNPVFEETFAWKLTEEVCQKPESVVVFTVKDFDAITRNDFLGEAVVPLANIPGVKKLRPLAQPMHLQLRSVECRQHPVLMILANRPWDNQAQEFADKQKAKVVTIKNANEPIKVKNTT